MKPHMQRLRGLWCALPPLYQYMAMTGSRRQIDEVVCSFVLLFCSRAVAVHKHASTRVQYVHSDVQLVQAPTLSNADGVELHLEQHVPTCRLAHKAFRMVSSSQSRRCCHKSVETAH